MRNRNMLIAAASGAMILLGACSDDSDKTANPPVDPRVVDFDKLDSGGGQDVAPADVPLPPPPADKSD